MKTFTLLVALTLTLSAHAGSCCKPAAAPKPDACCAAKAAMPETAPTNLTRNSIYQLDAKFTDDSGRPVQLSELRGRPVVLAMFFASCNYACPLTIGDMSRIREALPANVRERTVFVLVSFDTKRDTPEALARFRTERLLGSSWTILRGEDDVIAELAALLGVKFKKESDGQFAHSNLLTILNPEGEIVHQRVGLTGGLAETTAAVVRASP